MFYDTFHALCVERNISDSKACIEAGLSRSLAAKWKHTGENPSLDALHKMSDYFGVSVDFLMGKEKAPALTEKDRRDISHDLDNLMDKLESSGDLMFDGDPMSDEAKESLRAAMKLGLEAAKLKNKERFTPKKYRGKE